MSATLPKHTHDGTQSSTENFCLPTPNVLPLDIALIPSISCASGEFLVAGGHFFSCYFVAFVCKLSFKMGKRRTWHNRNPCGKLELSPGFRAQKQYSGGPQKLATSSKVTQDRLPSEASIPSVAMYANPPHDSPGFGTTLNLKSPRLPNMLFIQNDAEAWHWPA